MAALFATANPDGDSSAEPDGDGSELAALLVRAERVLEAVADEHGHDARPLLPEVVAQPG